jgi:phosphatidylethanolamine/phosphatidyl-N-methylethanolamine N-methyltransferase
MVALGRTLVFAANDKMEEIIMDTKRQRRESRFWDRFARFYDLFITKKSSGIYAKILELTLPELQPDWVVLDLATGTGLLALKMASQVHKVYGLDISAAMLGQAQAKAEERRIGNVEFRVGDACQLPFAEASFDAVVISNALHVMLEPERVLAEVHRVLKSDGRLIAPTFCHGENRLSRLVCWVMGWSGFKTFQRWSIAEYEQFIAVNGFKVIHKEVLKDIIPLTYLVAEKRVN